MKPPTFYRDNSLMLGLPSIFFRQQLRAPLTSSADTAAYDSEQPLLVLTSEHEHCSVIINLQRFMEMGLVMRPDQYYTMCRPWCSFLALSGGNMLAYMFAGGDTVHRWGKHLFMNQIQHFPEVRFMRQQLHELKSGTFTNANVFVLETMIPTEKPCELTYAQFEAATLYLCDVGRHQCPSAIDFLHFLQNISEACKQAPDDVPLDSKALKRIWMRTNRGFIDLPIPLSADDATCWKEKLLPHIRTIMRQEYDAPPLRPSDT